MKAITKLFLVLFAAITCFGCEKIENDNNEQNGDQNTQEDFYYVRYNVGVSTSHIPTTYITVNTDMGINEFEAVKTFEETFGPVSKGFNAEIDVVAEGAGWAETTASIHVSKNNGPFALKAYKSVSSSKINLSYKIDF